jgi:hypothetical protein
MSSRPAFGQSAERRRGTRNHHTRPLIKALKSWLEQHLKRIPPNGTLAEAIRYALARWPAPCRFLDDGRIEIDNNPVERASRPVALDRKNHLFVGSDRGAIRWTMLCSPIATAKINDVEPYAYLKDVLKRLSASYSIARLDDLLPWNWEPAYPL